MRPGDHTRARLKAAVPKAVETPQQTSRAPATPDDGNTVLATSVERVDQINAAFYTRFQYPWAPKTLDRLADEAWHARFLGCAVGGFDSQRVPATANIWVAGCGRNQAAITALRFPAGSVLGSDVSPGSLSACQDMARQVGASNLRLTRESILEAAYQEEFDYVLCTGVIHHTGDPEVALGSLARSLKPNGVLELMVYNRYHRMVVSAVQRVVRLLEATVDPDFEVELDLAKRLVAAGSIPHSPGGGAHYLQRGEEDLADALIQPVEHGYTVASLNSMAERCGLEILYPAVDQFDAAHGNIDWHTTFPDAELQRRYDALPDVDRWQVTQLLALGESPLLWFYLQREDGPKRRPEAEITAAFVGRRWVPAETERRTWVLRDEKYVPVVATTRYPAPHSDEECRVALARLAEGETMRAALGDVPFAEANRLRLMLTTPEYPYLQPAPGG